MTRPVAGVLVLLATCWWVVESLRTGRPVVAAVEVALTAGLFGATYLIVQGGQT